MTDASKLPGGAAFLWEPTGSREQMSPERFTDEQREMARAGWEFSVKEILPRVTEIESQQVGLIPQLLRLRMDWPMKVIAAKRRLAARVLEADGYPLA